MQVLDRATIDFTAKAPVVQEPPKQVQVKPLKHEDEEEDIEYHEPKKLEIDGAEPYWWLK
jgi:hypothetical protein